MFTHDNALKSDQKKALKKQTKPQETTKTSRKRTRKVHPPRPKRGSIPREIQSGPKDATSKRTESRSQNSAQAQKAGEGNPVIPFHSFFQNFQNFHLFFR